MPDLADFITRRPRAAAALAFGGVTAIVTHLAWIPSARLSGAAPALTVAAGLAHAIAGAFIGPRLVDGARTRTASQACLLGAATSLLAVVVFAPPFALWISATNAGSQGILSYLALTVLVGLFSFLGAGWALLLASVAVAWVLFRLTGSTATS